MRKAFLKVVPGIAVAVFFISCNKKNDAPSNTQTDLLTSFDWKISKYETSVNSDPTIDQYLTWSACTQDDRYIFKGDNTYEANEGATKCNSTDPQVIYTGTWLFSADGTKITIDGTEFTIEQLDNSTFIVSGSYYTNPDTNYYRITYIH